MLLLLLATVNYASPNNSMLRMCCRIYASFFAVTSKVNNSGFRHIVASV